MEGRMDMIWPRWTRARIYTTAFYSLIGLALGCIGAPLLASIGLCVMRSPLFILLLPAAPMISYYLSADATRNTCKKHVCAPQGVAIGMMLGALATASFFIAARDIETFLFGVFTCVNGVAWTLGAHYGGQKALRTHLGPRSRGLGLTCATCGYDLSGAPDHAPCSECGDAFRYARRPEEGV
jgi:hypothetical protein